MNLDLETPALARAHRESAPYARRMIERAGDHARALHADAIAIEHLLTVLMDDEECAAHQVVLHAFADPESISVEAMALSPGILVVGSSRSLPFSPGGVRVLHDAHALAGDQRAGAVSTVHLVASAIPLLEEEARAAVETSLSREGLAAVLEEEAGFGELPGGGAILAAFDDDAKRTLSGACHLAHRMGRRAIAPAHLVLAGLERERPLQERLGLSLVRVRDRLADRDRDSATLAPRPLAPDERLEALLRELPEGADTVALLAALSRAGTDDFRSIFGRNRITAELLERAAGAFRDPAPPGR